MACPECFDDQFVEIANQNEGRGMKVRPCSECLPESYQRWLVGQYKPKWVVRTQQMKGGPADTSVSMAEALKSARKQLEAKAR